jgi:hypothetical protein
MSDELDPKALDNPPSQVPTITIRLNPGGSVSVSYPNDAILTLGLLEMAKHTFLQRLAASQTDQRVIPVPFGTFRGGRG